MSLLMEYFRLFSSICNKRQAPLHLQEAQEILNLSENCLITYLPILPPAAVKNENRCCHSLLPSHPRPLPTHPQDSWGWGRGLHLPLPELRASDEQESGQRRQREEGKRVSSPRTMIRACPAPASTQGNSGLPENPLPSSYNWCSAGCRGGAGRGNKILPEGPLPCEFRDKPAHTALRAHPESGGQRGVEKG